MSPKLLFIFSRWSQDLCVVGSTGYKVPDLIGDWTHLFLDGPQKPTLVVCLFLLMLLIVLLPQLLLLRPPRLMKNRRRRWSNFGYLGPLRNP